jgi:two-component system OmpR family response regulator
MRARQRNNTGYDVGVRILVIDPTTTHGANLRVLLVSEGHEVEIVVAPPERIHHDVVIVAGERAITVNLVGLLRARDEALPILALTASGELDDVDGRVAGLRAGADDALSVPFAGSQMVARVDALGRRAKLVPRLPDLLEADGCMFDLSRCVAVRDGKVVQLSPREVELIRWLHRHRERTVERKEILEHVFRVSPEIETRSVDMAIATLRKKIEREPEKPAIIVSVKGLGYAWRHPN